VTLLDTIPYLESLGVKLRVVGNRLDINAPKGVLTPGLLNRLRREKGALIEALRRGVDTRDPENRRIRDLQTAGVSTPQDNHGDGVWNNPREAHSRAVVQGGLWGGVDTPAPENDRIRDLQPGGVSTPSMSTSHGTRSDPMIRAFRAAGLATEMPRDPDQARVRLHQLLEHQAPRPAGVPTGVDVVVLLGGRCPRPRLLCGYEPWPSDPAALPIRWRIAGDPSAAWKALGIAEQGKGSENG
jgi:tubulysin polyketide synthase-like protein